MSNALKAAAERVRKYGKYNDELLLATHVLEELDDTPLTVEHLRGMGFRETSAGWHLLRINDFYDLSIDPLDGCVCLDDGEDFDLPGTYRTVGALRRLLVGLKGDVP